MSRDEYGRGPVLQAVDKVVGIIRWDWVAQFMFAVAAYVMASIIANSGLAAWEQAAGLFSLMFVAASAYIAGTHDRGTYSNRDEDS